VHSIKRSRVPIRFIKFRRSRTYFVDAIENDCQGFARSWFTIECGDRRTEDDFTVKGGHFHFAFAFRRVTSVVLRDRTGG
jgi:hypothetical protein